MNPENPRHDSKSTPWHQQLIWWLDNVEVLTLRSLKHMVRNVDQLLSIVIMPVMFLLLFRYVFGGAIQTGETSYVNYLVAGILVQTLAFGASTTTINVALDLKRGIVDRFRSLPMSKSALLVGHVMCDLVRNALAGFNTLVVSFLVGFRPTADLVEWGYIIALLLLFTFSFSWLCAIIGMLISSVEAAEWASFVLIFPLTFASSAFVPTETMPHWLRVFAENQPFTHVTNAIRSWMVGTPLDNAALLAIFWCVLGIVLTAPLANWLFNRKTMK